MWGTAPWIDHWLSRLLERGVRNETEGDRGKTARPDQLWKPGSYRLQVQISGRMQFDPATTPESASRFQHSPTRKQTIVATNARYMKLNNLKFQAEDCWKGHAQQQ